MLLSMEEVMTEFSLPTTRDCMSMIRWKCADSTCREEEEEDQAGEGQK